MAANFLYLNEKDMIESGVLDAHECVETMRDMMSLFGKHDYIMGGPKGDEHGLQINFPKVSNIKGFPLDDGPDRRFNAMPAYLGGKYHIAGMKWYGSNVHNHEKNLPRSILMVSLNDVDTGLPIAYMSANLLSAMRTGAMPAMAASYLARKDSEVLSLIGPGVINKCALACYLDVCPSIHTVKIKGSSTISKGALSMKDYILNNFPQIKEIILCSTLEEACKDSDIISEAMPMQNVGMETFDPKWFKKGASVFSMGSFYIEDFETIKNMTMVVDNYGMYEKYMDNFIKRGEFDEAGNKRKWIIMGMHFIHLVKKNRISPYSIKNLCDIVNGLESGRTNEDEIVLCSIGGMPIEDVAWGYECYKKAINKNIGTTLNLWDSPYMK